MAGHGGHPHLLGSAGFSDALYSHSRGWGEYCYPCLNSHCGHLQFVLSPLSDRVFYLDFGHHLLIATQLPPCNGLLSSWKWSDCLETSGLSNPKIYMSSSGAGPAHFLPHFCLTAQPPTTDVMQGKCNGPEAGATCICTHTGGSYPRAIILVPSAQRSSPAHSLSQLPFKATCADHFVFFPPHSSAI